jgi:hypothetical protein
MRSWHLTDNPQFALDPSYHPANNTTLGGEWPNPGLFVAPRGGLNSWFYGYDYARPFAAEIEHPPVEGLGGYGGEHFLPADQFAQSRVLRVIPTDHAMWEDTGYPVYDDTGSYSGNYRYTGPDVREMPPEQTEQMAKRLRDHTWETRPHTRRVECPECGWDGQRTECWNDGRCPCCDKGMVVEKR